jgi:hypothetical protein
MAGRTFKTPPRSLTVYSSKVETTSADPFMIENTLVSPLMTSMFGGRLTWNKKEMLMDSWLDLDINTEKAMVDKHEAARILIELQKAINLVSGPTAPNFNPSLPSFNPMNPSVLNY